jgi:hypothetical protein
MTKNQKFLSEFAARRPAPCLSCYAPKILALYDAAGDLKKKNNHREHRVHRGGESKINLSSFIPPCSLCALWFKYSFWHGICFIIVKALGP